MIIVDNGCDRCHVATPTHKVMKADLLVLLCSHDLNQNVLAMVEQGWSWEPVSTSFVDYRAIVEAEEAKCQT